MQTLLEAYLCSVAISDKIVLMFLAKWFYDWAQKKYKYAK